MTMNTEPGANSLHSPSCVKVGDVCSVLSEQLVKGECIRPDSIVGVAGIVWRLIVHVAVKDQEVWINWSTGQAFGNIIHTYISHSLLSGTEITCFFILEEESNGIASLENTLSLSLFI